MKVPKLRLLIAGLFFFGWIGWLTYLAFNKTSPVVISRSQVMVATHFVLADIAIDANGQPLPSVTVAEDLRPVKGESLTGKTILVQHLKEARLGGASDFSKPGKYLLPLNKHPDGSYDITSPPSSPGNETLFGARPWAYRWEAPGVAEQFNRLVPAQP
jgi:hypothetical protein